MFDVREFKKVSMRLNTLKERAWRHKKNNGKISNGNCR